MFDVILALAIRAQGIVECDKGLLDSNGDCTTDILGIPPAVAAPILVVIAGVVYRYFTQKDKNK
jgi:hypothetical protein